jgi:predicted Rossmann-fold nucleotide-binding protein
MRVLVCGGRDYTDRGAVYLALDRLHEKRGIDVVIHGAARGADTLAADWAAANGVPAEPYPADWSRGRQAGPVRNQLMLDQGRPDGVVAFPGGAGTADMCRRAEAAGLRVWRPEAPAGR